MSTSFPRIGYVPYATNFAHPGDVRRFVAYARARRLPFEIARLEERYDVVVLSELADITVWSQYHGGKLVYELIDSYLAIPRRDPRQLLRGLVWYANGRHQRLRLDIRRAIEDMCRRADAVVCTTATQKRDISALCRNVHIVLDMHDDVVRGRKRDYTAGSPFNLVWEGLPSNVPQLKSIEPVLREMSLRREIVLNVVTDADRPAAMSWLPRIRTDKILRRIFDKVAFHSWNAATLTDVITACDIGVIPIFTNNPFTCGKPANKLALLWRMAMPVVTSATPAYREMQDATGLGYLCCENDAEWLTALERLCTDEAARREAAERGYAYVQENLGMNRLLTLWDAVFSSIGFDFCAGA